MNDNATFEFSGSGGTELGRSGETKPVDDINNKLHNNNRHNSKEEYSSAS